MGVVIYTDDFREVDPKTSWTGLSSVLRNAKQRDVYQITDARIDRLFGYASPDAVVVLDGEPVVSIEQTRMNPSGHNIPQRFSCLVRAAECGVPSILYYPAYSRRTLSDKNVRYLQVRVPIAQHRLSALYQVPSLSVFWPTDPETLLPDTRLTAHSAMADLVQELVEGAHAGTDPEALPGVKQARAKMVSEVDALAARYGQNPSVRLLLPAGFDSSIVRNTGAIDPPLTTTLVRTTDYIQSLRGKPSNPGWNAVETHLMQRPFTLVLTGTANRQRDDSEHPWPGYLTLYDILYCRTGPDQTNRAHNLAYRLPVDVDVFIGRAALPRPPSLTFIADSFADLIELSGGSVPGRPARGSIAPTACRRE